MSTQEQITAAWKKYLSCSQRLGITHPETKKAWAEYDRLRKGKKR